MCCSFVNFKNRYTLRYTLSIYIFLNKHHNFSCRQNKNNNKINKHTPFDKKKMRNWN